MDTDTEAVAAATARVATAYLKHQTVAAAALPDVLRGIGRAFAGLDAPAAPTERPAPAADLRRLVRSDMVICADCGWRGKSMKRHLATVHDLTPDAYRAKWGLAHDHPMVSPAYAARRSEVARASGLGRNRW